MTLETLSVNGGMGVTIKHWFVRRDRCAYVLCVRFDARFGVQPWSVGYHSPYPLQQGQSCIGGCEFTGGDCFGDCSFSYANTAWKVLQDRGEEALRELLEDGFRTYFPVEHPYLGEGI